jgi:hypothetical protein
MASDERSVLGYWEYFTVNYGYKVVDGWRCSRCKFHNWLIPGHVDTPGGASEVQHVDPMKYPGSAFCPDCGIRMQKGVVR